MNCHAPEAAMNTAINKQAVAQRFSRAAARYDAVAHLQMQVGQKLLSRLADLLLPPVGTALDIGCGTGKLTRQLQPFSQRLIALDLAPGMLAHARASHGDAISHFLCADADALPFADASLNLVFSNFALQWSADLPRLIRQMKNLLKPGGVLLFSMPIQGTLQELQDSWQQADAHQPHVNPFSCAADVRDALQQAGFQIGLLEEETRILHYSSVRELTAELKALGANTVQGEQSRTPVGKLAVTQMLAAYEQQRDDQGRLPASWNILHVLARRPGTHD